MKKFETVYIIDDDNSYQFVTKKTIEATSLVQQIKIFPNGKEAIDFLEKAIDAPELLPDLILLDLSMPVMDGWDFLENFLLMKPTIGKSIKIYIVSSSISPVDIGRANNISDVTDYIVKPITKDTIFNLFQTM